MDPVKMISTHIPDKTLYLALLMCFICYFLPYATYAQDHDLIQGRVIDKSTEAPLSGAHISLQGSSLGTISGPDGSFRIMADQWPVTLKITHIGYEEMLFNITKGMSDHEVILGLEFKPEMLEGVTITDQKVELIYKSPSFSVLDFEFHPYGIMLLIYRNSLKRADLVLLSMMEDTLATMKDLPGRAISLFRDCRQTLHYVATDTAYQIHFTGKDLKLIYPVHFIEFNVISNAFNAYLDHKFYYGTMRMQNQVIQYIRYDSLAQDYQPFWTVADQATLQILKDNPTHHYLLGNLVKSRNAEEDFNLFLMGSYASAEDQRLSLNLSRNASTEAHYLKNCVYKPVYAPLFTYHGNLVVFNHPNDRIEIITDKGECLSNVPITYQHDDNWGRLILKDDIREEFYTVEIENTRSSLRLIDPGNGKRGSLNLLHHTQVKKILVRNGYAYFTYHQPGTLERTMLFRQKLKQWDEAAAD